ncbi:RHS repeat domain-containing protein [Bacteroides sp.]|uniref:RHS repeat domain-containing protein n=1 Tax=Bacteroides sp. TaxID=29523 RepID=UPI0025BE5432|nr:RHS repeat-associated core domain-containing protein [Bacteroides sp.]
MSYDAWGKLRNPATQAIYAPGSEPELFLGRGYTGHEHLAVFGLINMNARLYDPALGRFLSPDPYVQNPDFSQNFNRYSYCLNNPLIYVDQNGEWFLIDDLIAAAIGGIFNVIVNAVQGNIHSVGQGFALFGTGAASGFVTIYAGPIAGAAVLGATNSIVNQGFNNGWGNIDWMQVGSSGIMGGATSYLGGNLGSYFAKPISKLTEGIASPILKEVLTQGTLNSATGFGLGTAMALGSGADLGEALKQGGQSAALGLMSGIMNGTADGIKAARNAGKNPWRINKNTDNSLEQNVKASKNGTNRSEVRTEPANLEEQLTLKEAIANPGKEIMKGQINDPRWKGWNKMEYKHKLPSGNNIEIHYWQQNNIKKGFKFKNPIWKR